MAKASWLTLNPESGSGNASVINSATENTGRNQRSTTVTGVATGVSPNKTYEVIQQGKAEFVSFDSSAASVANSGGTLTITGKSNSAKLTFSLVYGGVDNPDTADVLETLQLTLPDNYTAGGASTANGAEISGDPGASQEYAFSITFENIAANTTINDLVEALKVTAEGGQTAQIQITQTASEASFEFGSATITLDSDGTAVTQTITSNTSWTLE